MGPVATAAPTAVPAGKAKRPIPPGIQTNGSGVARPSPSPSPSMSAKKAPNSAKSANSGPAPNGAASHVPRPQKPRREASVQLGRNSRNSAGLRSASLAAEPTSRVAKPPTSKTTQEILKTFVGCPPSLIIHLHPTNFRFDQQDGAFSYTSPMKVFIEHLKQRTVPHEHDLLRDLLQAGVQFYDGCLIVQIHDHRSVAQASNAPKPAASASANNTTVSSIHNYNPYLTPSTRTYPQTETQNEADGDASADGKSQDKSDDKASMTAPSLPTNAKSKPPPKPRVYTAVLFPTAQSLQTDLLLTATTPRTSADAKDDAVPPSTPLTAGTPAAPSTSMPPPAKRQKRENAELDSASLRSIEGQLLLATYPDLDLEPTRNKEEMIAKLEREAKLHPRNCEPPPEPKARKRTVAEMAADQAQIADHERFMLHADDRLGSSANGAQTATAGGDGGNGGGATSFEPRFERFQAIMDIKQQHADKKEKERIQQAENQKQVEAQRQQQQLREQQAAQHRQQEIQRERREAAQREVAAKQQQQQQEAQRKAAAAQAAKAKQQQAKNQANAQNVNAAKAAAAKAKANANAANSNANAAQNAAHANVAHTNGMQGPQATPRFHQQVSQPQASSPVVGQGTPHSMSSPMVGGVAMQPSNSGMAGSPPRPPSAVQTQTPMAVPTAPSMSARGSQQSHHGGTPRIASGTPNMAHVTPINRPATLQTPRMSQASSPPAMMAQGSQMGHQMMGNQGMPQMHQPNAMAAQQLAQQKRILAQQMALQNGMMNGQNLTPQQQHLLQQQQQQRMQQLMMQHQQQQQQQQQGHPQQQHPQQQQRNGMMNPLAQQYAQSMNQMQGQLSPQMQMQLQQRINQMNQANQMGGQMGGQMGRGAAQGQNMMGGGGGSPANMQAAFLQMQQQQQQQRQSQTAALQNQVQARGTLLYQNNIENLIKQFGGRENIPELAHDKFKADCMNRARATVMQQARMQQQQQQQAAIQQQQQMAMQQGMMGGHQGM